MTAQHSDLFTEAAERALAARQAAEAAVGRRETELGIDSLAEIVLLMQDAAALLCPECREAFEARVYQEPS